MRLKEYFSIRCAVGRLAVDPAPPLQGLALEVGVRDDLVDHAHPVRVLGVVLVAEEEDLAGELLADLAGEVRRPEPAVERADVGVGLLEACVLAGGEREVGDDVQAVAAAGRPAGDHADDDLRHEADQPLALEDVQPAELRLVDGLGGLPLGVLVAGAAADPLVAAGAERPAAVARRGAVAGEDARSRRRWTAGRARGPAAARRRCPAGRRCAPRAGRRRCARCRARRPGGRSGRPGPRSR